MNPPQPARRRVGPLAIAALALLAGAITVIALSPARPIIDPPIEIKVHLEARETGALQVTGSQTPSLNVRTSQSGHTATIRQGDPLFLHVTVENPGNRSVRICPINRIGHFQLRLTTPSGAVISPVPAHRDVVCGLWSSVEFGPRESMWVDSFVFEYSHSQWGKPTQMRYCFSEIGEYTLIAEYDPEISGQRLEGVNAGPIFSDPIRITVEPAPEGEPPLPGFESMRIALWAPASDEAAAILPADPADDAVPTRPWMLTLRTMVRTSRAAVEAQSRSDN